MNTETNDQPNEAKELKTAYDQLGKSYDFVASFRSTLIQLLRATRAGGVLCAGATIQVHGSCEEGLQGGSAVRGIGDERSAIDEPDLALVSLRQANRCRRRRRRRRQAISQRVLLLLLALVALSGCHSDPSDQTVVRILAALAASQALLSNRENGAANRRA
jgi:hypothetical protein